MYRNIGDLAHRVTLLKAKAPAELILVMTNYYALYQYQYNI